LRIGSEGRKPCRTISIRSFVWRNEIYAQAALADITRCVPETRGTIERLLIRFGEALKSTPNHTLTQIDSNIAWAGPKGFRDIASHWYEEGLDHRLIWHALANDLPPMLNSLQRWIDNQQSDSAP